MKKEIVLITLLSATTFLANAQTGISNGVTIEKETLLFAMNALAILLTIYIVSSFLLSLIRMFLDDRLRRTLLERNASEELVKQMMPKREKGYHIALKWCCLLIALGFGLLICYYAQPYGMHSAVILSFALAIGLLAFYLISKPKRDSES